MKANIVSDPWVEDWAVLAGGRQNMLLVGSRGALVEWLDGAAMWLRGPVHHIACEHGLGLPPRLETLVLDNVADLNAQEQARLLHWLDDPEHARIQVIALTTTPLYPLVQAGVFSSALYYRLNVCYFVISMRAGSRGVHPATMINTRGVRELAM